MLGDERMTCMKCNCGAHYDRMASHKKRVLGFQCRHCLTHWRTFAVSDDEGQMEMWFKYYECTCKSNSLNIEPKNKYCICPVVDLR